MYTASAPCLGGPTSRRITRRAGTSLSWSRGGKAKPRRSTNPVAAPCNTGERPGGLKAVDALAPPEARPRPLLELPDPLALTGGEQLIVDAASGLHESRRG